MEPISKDTLHKLAQFDSPTICNVIELFNVRPRNQGYMGGQIHCNFPEFPPMVGYAVTATFRADSPSTRADSYNRLADQLEQFAEVPGPKVVVFQDLDDPPVAAVFGEVMCSTYQAFGAVGLITSGGGRDLEQVQELRFPVFTGSTIVSHAYSQIVHLAEPVRVGGLMVYEGDLMHGDVNGVTNIPAEIAAEVADISEAFVAAEAIVMDYVKGPGEKNVEEYRARQKEFKEAVKALSQRVQRS